MAALGDWAPPIVATQGGHGGPPLPGRIPSVPISGPLPDFEQELAADVPVVDPFVGAPDFGERDDLFDRGAQSSSIRPAREIEEVGAAGADDDPPGALFRSDPEYASLFQSAFPDEADPYTLGTMTRAIATFVTAAASLD